MTGTHSKHRTAAAALLAGTVVATSLLFLASPAQAAGCVETRATAKDLAAAGDYAETTAKMEVLGLSLRISAGAGCAWGIVAGLTRDMSADVWLDRSTDGGASWVKSAVRKTRPLNPSTTAPDLGLKRI